MGALATAAWAVHGQVLHLPLLLTRLPAFGFLGAVTAWTGAVFLRQAAQSPGTRLTGWCLIWGPVLEVRDTGRGMEESTLEHLFEPFFTTKGAGRGTGLGLATVYGVVTQTGGFIDVQSAVGQGTVFRVYLPATEGAIAPSRQTRLTPTPAGMSGATVLLAEDEASLRVLVERMLREAGYRVLSAADGAAALEIARAEGRTIDLLITDVVMPGMSGPALAAELRAVRSDLPVVFVSGYANHHAETGLDAGARFLAKPFAPAELLEAVRACLRESRTASTARAG